MEEYYQIEHLSDKIGFTDDALHFVTESTLFNELVNMHEVDIKTNHINNLRCTRKQVLNYSRNLEITTWNLSQELFKIASEITEARYITLKKITAMNNNLNVHFSI